MQMTNLNISSKAEKFGVKIAKDGVFRSAEEILTQKMSIWVKLERFGLKF